jgi:Rrf2 family nitric oxide-sensitive transcriptional repressor
MQLTRYTDYSLRVLLYLAASEPGQRVTVGDIADRFSIARNHLVKVVNRLGQLGYVKTIRGKGGGIVLGRDSADIGLGAVVRDMESNLNLIDCNQPPCPLRSNCQLKGILNQAGRAFLKVLDDYTLADLVRQPEPLRVLLQLPG